MSSLSRVLAAFALLATVLAGCIDESGPAGTDGSDGVAEETVDWARPLPATITGLEPFATATDVPGTAGIWLDGDLAYVSGPGSGFFVVNVSVPDAPVVMGSIDEPSRDVDLMKLDNGTKIAVLSSGAVDFVDVSDPEAPVLVGSHPTEGAVHNVAVVPGTGIVYNSRSLDLPGVDILDASDPWAPMQVGVFGDLTCHDITFVMERDRAYCAGIRETQIWDIADPTAPVVVSRIVNPAIQIHHAVVPAHNGSLLIIGDEFAGSTQAAFGCWAAADVPVVPGTQSDPMGAVWFYDTSDEALPKPLGWLSVAAPVDNLPAAPCTAHFGTLVGDAEGVRDLLIMGWRYSGTHLIDFSDPTAPVLMDTHRTSGDTWDARVHKGYVFAASSEVGLEILSFV